VTKINTTIGQDPNSKVLIGVLDIYGFESFKTNRCLTGMPLHLVLFLPASNFDMKCHRTTVERYLFGWNWIFFEGMELDMLVYHRNMFSPICLIALEVFVSLQISPSLVDLVQNDQ
jgi:hypothetical protein